MAEKSFTTQLDSWHSFTHEMNEKGIPFQNYLVKAEFIKCDEKVSSFFNVPVQTEVLKITRLRGDESGPYVFFESYIHPRIGVRKDESFEEPLYELLEKKYKTPVSISNEKIKARLASEITAKRLKIKQGEPVLIRERFVSDPGNRPVEYNIGFYIAEKFTYSIEIRR